VNFALTNTAGSVTTLLVSSGSPQSAAVATAFNPLVALAKDTYGNVVPNATVSFTAPASGASGTFANGTRTTNATTNASGLATSSTFTANATAGGSYNVVATSGTGSVTFMLANTTTAGSLTLSPTSGHASTTTVTLSGTGWAHSSTLTATFNGSPVTLTNGTTASNGHITGACTFTVPNLTVGIYMVVIQDGGGNVGAANFTIN
jgi:hypothetical protein